MLLSDALASAVSVAADAVLADPVPTPHSCRSAVADASGPTDADFDAAAAATEPPLLRPYDMPASVYDSVMRDNLQVLQEKHTMTKPYFKCAAVAVLPG